MRAAADEYAAISTVASETFFSGERSRFEIEQCFKKLFLPFRTYKCDGPAIHLLITTEKALNAECVR